MTTSTETIESRHGTLTVTRAGYVVDIRGEDRRFGREPQVFTAHIEVCDCRANPDSTRRLGLYGITRANLGTRPLCPKEPGHNETCHRKMDHCASGWHEQDFDVRIKRLIKALVESYR